MKNKLKDLFVFLSFFPYINFNMQHEIVPIFTLALIPFLNYKKELINLPVVYIVITTFVFLINYLISSDNLVILVYFYSLIIFIYLLIMNSNIKIKYSLIKKINLIWLITIIFSNFSFFTHWEILAGNIMHRVYSCAFPFTCARGGSGLAPEPSYAALIVFIIGLYFIVELKYNIEERKNSITTDLMVSIISLFLLKCIIAYVYIIILIMLLAAQHRIVLKYIYLSIVILLLISLSYKLKTPNSFDRIQNFFVGLYKTKSIDDMFSLIVNHGSTREIGTICGFISSDLIIINQNHQVEKFKQCQNEFYYKFRHTVFRSGWKPYSPVSFLTLYYGYFILFTIIINFLMPLQKIKNKSLIVIYFILIFLISFRIMVLFPTVYLLIAHVKNTFNKDT